MKNLPSIAIGLLMAGCVTPGAKAPAPWIDATQSACSIARAQLARCDAGQDLNRSRCRTASDAALVCAIWSKPETSLLASPLAPGVGLTPRSLRTCWRETVSGPQKFGIGRPDIDPWTVAGMPGGSQGGLPCQLAEVNEAYRLAFGQPCIGPGAALGGYCGGPSNEALRSATPLLEWACRERPDLIGSEGAATWNCRPGGLDLLRLAAFMGGNEMLAAIRSAMPQDPAPALCPNGRIDPGETCVTCPADAGACPPPPPPPPVDPRLDCSGLRLPPPGKAAFVAQEAGLGSTGLSAYRLFECRGGSLPTPEPVRPEISAATRATLSAVCGWLRSDQPTRRRRCAAAVAEVLGMDAVAAQIEAEELAGRGVLADRETFECARLRAEAAAAGEAAPSCGSRP